jgi:DNA-directed RNA polymerase alpha subunit
MSKALSRMGRLAALSDAELLRVPTLGRKTLDEVKQLLRALGVERA